MVKHLLELFLQRFGALAPEVSLLLAVVTTVVLLFHVIGHPDGSSIDLSVEGHLHVIPIWCRIVIIDVLQDVVFLGLNLHGRLHLCGMDGDIRVVICILPVVACLILLDVIWSTWMRVRVVGPIGEFACGLGVCFDILRMSTPAVLSLILFTLTHGDQ